MTDDERRNVESFASEILRRYFCDGDVDFLVSTFAPDMVWIGNGNMQIAHGADAAGRWFRGSKDSIVACRMWNEEYTTVEQAPGIYLCCTCCELESLVPETPLRVRQRTAFLFRRVDDRLLVAHMHHSPPFEETHKQPVAPSNTLREDVHNLQEALDQKDRQIDLMLHQLPGGMLICRPGEALGIKWISNGLCRLLGYSGPSQLTQATGGNYTPCIHPEDMDRVRRQSDEAFATGDACSVEYRAIRRDGSVLWVLDVSKMFEDADGQTTICSYVADISTRVAREKELKRINQEMTRQTNFLSQLYDTVPCGITQVAFSPTPHVVFINKKALEIYGMDHFEGSDEDLHHAIMAGPMRDAHKTIERLHREGGRVTYERELVRPDGTTCWLSSLIEAITNAAGERVLQVIITDITENKLLQMEHEQERLIENRSLHTAVCSAYQLILRVNLTRNVYAEVSEESYITAVTPCGTVDKLLQDTLPGILPAHRDEFLRTFNPPNIKSRFESGEKELYMELQRLGADGEYHWVSMHCIRIDPVKDDAEDVLGILLVKVLDEQRTEKARQEMLLRDALSAAQAANLAKSDFLSRMSHDIRTPMNAIIGMSAIGQLKLHDHNRVLDCFKKIDTSCRYLLSLINDILDMSRIESGKMVLSANKFELGELLGQVHVIIHPQAAMAGVSYEVSSQVPMERAYVGDVLRINQILMNLLSNAVKFTPKGGKITLHIRETHCASRTAQLELVVSDTGLGMSPAFLNRLFEPFEQEHADTARNKAGSGLGLSIVYNLVHLMGGTIDVNSEPGRGTTFVLKLPLGLAEAKEAMDKLRKTAGLLRGLSVLVVDDDELVGEQVSLIMENIGGHALWVDSGFHAVEAVQRARENDKYFDVALVDWKMPGMGGLETTRRLRELVGQRTRIVIITAYDWDEIEAVAREAGADHFLSKPLFQAALSQVLLESSGRHSLAEQHAAQVEPCTGKRVLLVEDNEINMEIARSVLEMRGMTVDVAENGQVALECFQQSDPHYYQVILMDIRMPKLDGLDATRAIRTLPRPDAASVPIIAMSANAFDDDKLLALQAGMNDYVVKPIDLDTLFNTLNEWLR